MSYTLSYSLVNNGYAVTGYSGTPVEVVIPSEYNGASVVSIGKTAFMSCDSLTSVTIPDSVTSIGYRAFYKCGSLTKIVIPDSVTEIGGEAFYGCSSLTKIVIPDSVTSIGASTFLGCENLKNITIPDSVTSIGISAFSGCSSLTSITIPDSVTIIGSNAFLGCNSLTSVNLLSILPRNISSQVFTLTHPDLKFYCHSKTIDAYKTAMNWNVYADKFIADDMRLYFIMNASAQKKYFVSKEELSNFSSGSSVIDVTELPTSNIDTNATYRMMKGTFYMRYGKR